MSVGQFLSITDNPASKPYNVIPLIVAPAPKCRHWLVCTYF